MSYPNNNNNNGGYYPPTSPPPHHQGYPAPGGPYPQTPYVPNTTYQPSPAGPYPPPPQSPLGQAPSPYPPVSGAGWYPPPPPPSGNPYGPPVNPPYGMPSSMPAAVPTMPTEIPTPHPSGIPQAMPAPHVYGQQQEPYTPSMPAPHQQYPQRQPQQPYPSEQPYSPQQPYPSQQPYPPPQPYQHQQPQQPYQHQQPYPHQQSYQPQQQQGPPVEFKCGPFLRYQNLNVREGVWLGSVLMVAKPESYGRRPPELKWSDGRFASGTVRAEPIHTYNQSVFWRFELRIPQEDHVTKPIDYSIDNGPTYRFFVAGKAESFRWMFYSCNGFSLSTDSSALGGANPLWNDAMAKHQERPYHVMIGGGDQLYCDGLLNTKEMAAWLAITPVSDREKASCKPDWKVAIEQYYFNRYCEWFSQGTYATAMASIPSVNMWDDHDTIDGYGSYPEPTQKSPVMTTIGETSRRFYLLFQQHTVPEMTSRHGFISAGIGESILTSLGPSTSLLVLDARSERTKNMVCSERTYNLVFEKLYQDIHVPQGTRHLLVQLGVPIAYPRLVFAENLMGSVGSVLGGIAGGKNVVNRLNGEPELLDDLNDHWTAKSHKFERNNFVRRLQKFADDRKIRVTFLSGDVHCAGVGRFYAKVSPPEKDFHLMYQIISSAIVNEPPPEGVIKLLHFQDKVHTMKGDPLPGDKVTTYEDMYPMFTTDVDEKPLQMDKLLPRRNYSQGHFNHHTSSIEITIFAEKVRGGPEHIPANDKGTKGYTIHVPHLV